MFEECECIHCEHFWDEEMPCCWCNKEPDWHIEWGDGDNDDEDLDDIEEAN